MQEIQGWKAQLREAERADETPVRGRRSPPVVSAVETAANAIFGELKELVEQRPLDLLKALEVKATRLEFRRLIEALSKFANLAAELGGVDQAGERKRGLLERIENRLASSEQLWNTWLAGMGSSRDVDLIIRHSPLTEDRMREAEFARTVQSRIESLTSEPNWQKVIDLADLFQQAPEGREWVAGYLHQALAAVDSAQTALARSMPFPIAVRAYEALESLLDRVDADLHVHLREFLAHQERVAYPSLPELASNYMAAKHDRTQEFTRVQVIEQARYVLAKREFSKEDFRMAHKISTEFLDKMGIHRITFMQAIRLDKRAQAKKLAAAYPAVLVERDPITGLTPLDAAARRLAELHNASQPSRWQIRKQEKLLLELHAAHANHLGTDSATPRLAAVNQAAQELLFVPLSDRFFPSLVETYASHFDSSLDMAVPRSKLRVKQDPDYNADQRMYARWALLTSQAIADRLDETWTTPLQALIDMAAHTRSLMAYMSDTEDKHHFGVRREPGEVEYTPIADSKYEEWEGFITGRVPPFIPQDVGEGFPAWALIGSSGQRKLLHIPIPLPKADGTDTVYPTRIKFEDDRPVYWIQDADIDEVAGEAEAYYAKLQKTGARSPGFERTVANFYHAMAHYSPMRRGSAAVLMMVFNGVLLNKKRKPPEAVEGLDCYAMSMGQEEFATRVMAPWLAGTFNREDLLA